MAFVVLLKSVCRRRCSLCHLFSTSTSAAAADAETSLSFSTVKDSIFCYESNRIRSISILFSFPDQSCNRYAADHALRRISQSMDSTSRCQLLDSFLPLASSEKDFAALLLSYGSAFLPKKALAAFHHRLAADGPSSLSTLSFNALLSAFNKSRCHRQVPGLFIRLCEEYLISPDVVSYGLLIKALFLSHRPNEAFATLKQIRDEKGIVLTYQIYKLLLFWLRSRQKFEEAEQLWNEMIADGFKPDCTAYNVKGWCHAFRGETERVLELIREMEAAGVARVEPDTTTYNYLIGCLSKNDRVEDVKEVYKMMLSKKGRCSPDSATINNVLCCLCRHGDFETGLEVFRDGLSNNKVPQLRVLRKLVQGLVKQGKVEAAKEVVKEATNFRASFTGLWKEVKDLRLGSDCEVADISVEVV